MISELFARMGEFAARLLSGGTFEIVLLIVLIIVGLILFLVALWILWKLLVLLGKGLLWIFRTGGDATKRQAAARREARLAAPPPVATSWGASPRIGLRKALAEARRLVGPDALQILVVAGDGMADLCRSAGLIPPGVGTVGIAAGANTILIDAARADGRTLRRLASALPWRRPVDGVAAIVAPDGIPGETLRRTANFARATGLRVALHFVLASGSRTAAWRIVDANNRDGGTLCAQLAHDAARVWLTGGSREGLKELSLAQFRDLPSVLDRVFAAAPSSTVDVASLSFGGAGLRAAVAQTTGLTRPAVTPGLSIWTGFAVLIAGTALAGLVAIDGLDRAKNLRAVVRTAQHEAVTPWVATGIDAVPSGSRVRRMAGLGVRLAEFSDFSPLAPLAPVVPHYFAPGELGAALMDAYVLRPLAASLDRRARESLTPSDDPVAWIENARLVGEWLAAWEGLGRGPEEVDLRRLFADAFGGEPDAWSEGTDLALVRTAATLPSPSQGGLDVDALTELARRNFVSTMQRWAARVYTNGPVADAARRAVHRGATWREEHDALRDLRTTLQDPGQYWLTAAEDRPDYGFELRMLGRALALSVLGQATALEAKAAVSRIRIDARKAAEHFILPGVGPLMVRSSTGARGAGGGPSLSLSSLAEAWLAFLERIRGAGFSDLPQSSPRVARGPVTIAPAPVAATRAKLRVFDRFASNLPASLPPSVAQGLLLEVASELFIGVAASAELALRPAADVDFADQQALRLAKVGPALEDLEEIESWLLERQADDEAERVFQVRSRVAETMLKSGVSVLLSEDPIGIHLDPTADSNALVRRFERGVERLRRVYEQFARPYVGAGLFGSGLAASEWYQIGEDLAGYDRGDVNAALSGLEGMLRAYADDPGAACDAPRATHAAARDDYIARAMSRFRSQLDRVCAERSLARSREMHDSLADYFTRHVAWQWPYAGDPDAPELPGSTLSEFVRRLHAGAEALAGFDGSLAGLFRTSARFWLRDEDGGIAVPFRFDLRVRPTEEKLAEHVIAFEFDGIEQDEDGLHTWRYGTPAALKLRLAKNSPYRFVGSEDPDGLVHTVEGSGNGALLRILRDLSGGILAVEAEVVDGRGRWPLRITARFTHPDGMPMNVPRFHEFPRDKLGGYVGPDIAAAGE